jgi:hypothetical protein
MNKVLGGLAVLILVALAAAYVGSPFYAFQQLKEAARSGDRERLEAMVDFPAVREDLKRQVDSKATKLARGAEGIGYPIAAILGKLGASLGDKSIDKLVTPEAISAMVQSGRAPRGHHKSDTGGKPAAATVGYGYLTPDRFRFRVAPAEAPDEPIDLIMERHGLVSWRLEAIELPK